MENVGMQRTVFMSFNASMPDPPMSLLCSATDMRSKPSCRMVVSPIAAKFLSRLSERSPERVRIFEGGSGDLLMQASDQTLDGFQPLVAGQWKAGIIQPIITTGSVMAQKSKIFSMIFLPRC